MRFIVFLFAAALVACEDQTADPGPPAGALAALTAEQDHSYGMGKCDSCHGAPPPPSWASDPSLITSIELKEVLAPGSSPEPICRASIYEADLSASRVSAAHQALTAGGIWSLESPAAHRAVATLRHNQWDCLAEWIVASSMFSFEGEAVTEFATHQPTAFLFVRRTGFSECIVGSMAVFDDDDHPTFFALLKKLDLLEESLDWKEERGERATPPDQADRPAVDH